MGDAILHFVLEVKTCRRDTPGVGSLTGQDVRPNVARAAAGFPAGSARRRQQ
jgi:hypothetical protein